MNFDKLSPEMRSAIAEEMRKDKALKEASAMRESMMAQVLNLQAERDELKAKIKAFLEAWQIDVSGHDGEMMINIKTPASGIDEWGEPRRGTIFGFESTPDDNLPQWSGRGKTLWDLWNAVNQK
jgi:hypothetical protein